ncbi:MAG: ATP synthase F1 subunit epsilon [Candidatus Levybacteria bacterium RBG_16_35_11]|nr:MAG: ATP synthase F1 subunit epsilon [Candidatus Levybacteria bacterium RBG_16_35_11]
MAFQFEIVTPEKIVFKDEVDEILVNTEQGQIGVLQNHVSLLTRLVPGELTIKKGPRTQHLAVSGGFLEVGDNKATILADYALRAEDIEVAKAQEAQKRAERAMKEKASEHDLRIAEAELQKAILELNVARKRRTIPK